MSDAEGRAEFARQLSALGVAAEPLDEARPASLVFPLAILSGRFAGASVRIGVTVPPDFDRTAPSGPHICPALIRLHGGGPGNVGGSDFGPDFEYWSRPYTTWGRDGRTVSAYLAFLRKLFHET